MSALLPDSGADTSCGWRHWGEHPISSWVRGNWIREEAPDFLAPFPQPPASATAGDQAPAKVVSPAAISKAVGLNSVCPSLVEALVKFRADDLLPLKLYCLLCTTCPGLWESRRAQNSTEKSTYRTRSQV